MFSKPTITNRNDSITRKDVKTVLGSGSGLAGAVPEPKVVTDTASMPDNSLALPPEAELPPGARLIVGPDVKLKGAEILDCDTLVVEEIGRASCRERV